MKRGGNVLMEQCDKLWVELWQWGVVGIVVVVGREGLRRLVIIHSVVVVIIIIIVVIVE